MLCFKIILFTALLRIPEAYKNEFLDSIHYSVYGFISPRQYKSLIYYIESSTHCRSMSGHAFMDRPAARLETMALVIHSYVLV